MSYTQYTKHVPAILWIRPMHAPSPFFKHCTQQWNSTLSHVHLTYCPVHDNPEMVMNFVVLLFSTPILSTVLIYRGIPQKITLEKKKTFITYDCSVTVHVGTFQPEPTHLPLVLGGWRQELNWHRFVWDLHPTSFTFDCWKQIAGSKIRISNWRSRKMFQRTVSKIWQFYQYIQSLPLRVDHFLTKTPFTNRDKQTKPPLAMQLVNIGFFSIFRVVENQSLKSPRLTISKEAPCRRISFAMAVFYPGALRKLGGVIDTWQSRVSNAGQNKQSLLRLATHSSKDKKT